MPFQNQPYPWSRDSIVESAPRRSGVYGLYSALWIYIGEADDLRERFMEHFNGDSPCTRRYVPTYFVFELIDNRSARGSRYRAAVAHLLKVHNFEPAGDTKTLRWFLRRGAPKALAMRVRDAIDSRVALS